MRRLLTLAPLLLAACGSAPEPPAEGLPPETLQSHMQMHYAHAAAMREIVIVGDVSKLHVSAARLGADTRHAELPPTAAPFVERMNHAARRADGAGTLAEASRAVAEVAAACGACHEAHGAELAPSPIGDPAETLDNPGHMRRHHWATAKLWDGLVRPSWQDWKTGADALSEHALFPQNLEPFGAGPETAPLIEALHAAGERAGTVDPAGRAAVFADVLATCAGCHSRRGEPEHPYAPPGE